MAEQRQRAKAAARKVDHYENLDSYQDVLDRFGPTEFVGRQEIETKGTVLAIVGDAIFLDRSPFYAEQGGQIGDTGWITTDTGKARVVDTTYAVPGLHRHHVEYIDGEVTPGPGGRGRHRRRAAGTRSGATTPAPTSSTGPSARCSATHVKQQGSLVAPDRLRFDFGPADALSPQQIREIEDLANQQILENHPVRAYETSREHADEIGAIAFFGEKYGDVVRVVEAGPHSTELCGGTHVRSLGDIGPLKIVSEQSIGANIRRIDAVTGFGTIERLRRDEDLLEQVAEVLNVPVGEVVDGARRRVDDIKALQGEMKTLRAPGGRGPGGRPGRRGGERRGRGPDRRAGPGRPARPGAGHPGPRRRAGRGPGRCARWRWGGDHGRGAPRQRAARRRADRRRGPAHPGRRGPGPRVRPGRRARTRPASTRPSTWSARALA